MPDGKLKLRVVDVFGRPICEAVDVSLRNQTLSDAPAFRHLDCSQEITISGLNVFPNGLYRIEIDALSYHTVSRFVSIPADGNGEVTVTMPINPKKVVKVEFPAYVDLPVDTKTLLEKSQSVINFEGSSGAELYSRLDDIRKAGFLNLVAKARRTVFAATRRSVLSYLDELCMLQGDRFLTKAPLELRSEVSNSSHNELFHRVSELLHNPPPNFERDKSFKTLDHYGNLQLSFFKNSSGEFMVDLDIDDAQGFDHLFQVVGNLFGGPTHPYNIHEILLASQELNPGYGLLLHSATGTAGVPA